MLLISFNLQPRFQTLMSVQATLVFMEAVIITKIVIVATAISDGVDQDVVRDTLDGFFYICIRY